MSDTAELEKIIDQHQDRIALWWFGEPIFYKELFGQIGIVSLKWAIDFKCFCKVDNEETLPLYPACEYFKQIQEESR